MDCIHKKESHNSQWGKKNTHTKSKHLKWQRHVSLQWEISFIRSFVMCFTHGNCSETNPFQNQDKEEQESNTQPICAPLIEIGEDNSSGRSMNSRTERNENHPWRRKPNRLQRRNAWTLPETRIVPGMIEANKKKYEGGKRLNYGYLTSKQRFGLGGNFGWKMVGGERRKQWSVGQLELACAEPSTTTLNAKAPKFWFKPNI